MRQVRARLLAALATGLCVPAWGNDTNYQNYLVGERALGLGGAYCALADDASGAFYNPAGVARVPFSSLSASLSIYGVERQQRDRAYTAELPGDSGSEFVTVDLTDTHVATLPTTVALVRKLGGPMADGVSRHAVGFATYLPYSTAFEDDVVVGSSASDGRLSVRETDRTLWIGPFYSVRISERLSLGVATHYSYRTVKRFQSRVWEDEDVDGLSNSIGLEEIDVAYASHELFARAGARYDFGAGLSLGLAATTPSAHLKGSGRFRSERLSTRLNEPDDSYTPTVDDGLDTRNPEPVTVRAGVAWQRERALAALDATFHAPEEFNPIVLENVDASVGTLHISTVEREPVLNVNAGGEYVFAGKFPVRAGLLTNFSSAPEVRAGPQPQLSRVDMYGATTSVGYATQDYEVSVGALYAFGSGQASAINQSAAGDAQFEPRSVRNDFVYFYISGAQKALGKAVKKLMGSSSEK